MLTIIPARMCFISCVEKLKSFKIRKYAYRDTLRTANNINMRETLKRMSPNVWNARIGIIYIWTWRLEIVAAKSIRQSGTAWSTAKNYPILANVARSCFS